MKTKRRLLRNALSAAAQTVTSAAILFFLYRYLFRELGPERLGIWAVVLASTSVGRLTDMGFAGTVLKFVAGSVAIGDTPRAQRLLQTAAITIAATLCGLAIVALPLLNLILGWSLPETAIPLAMQVLPFALGSLLISMISGIFQSGIDACQRMYLKNGLLITGNVGFVAITVALVPTYGLLGVALAQLTQSFFLLAGSWILLQRLLPGLPLLPIYWGKTEFKEMIGYATNFQVGMIAGMLFDPLSKIFLAKFGDLTITAYYDMANQLVQKVRAVVVSAQQALVPEIAAIQDQNNAKRERLFADSYGHSFFLIVPYFCAIALSLPFISWIWIGHYQPLFVQCGSLICLGWFTASLSSVSYFYNLGTAHLSWNTFNHILTGLLNVSFGWLLGLLYSGIGVAIAAMLALMIPNLILNFTVFRRLNIEWREFLPSAHRTYAMIVALGAVGIAAGANYLELFTKGSITSLLPIIAFSALYPFAASADPIGRNLWAALRHRAGV